MLNVVGVKKLEEKDEYGKSIWEYDTAGDLEGFNIKRGIASNYFDAQIKLFAPYVKGRTARDHDDYFYKCFSSTIFCYAKMLEDEHVQDLRKKRRFRSGSQGILSWM